MSKTKQKQLLSKNSTANFRKAKSTKTLLECEHCKHIQKTSKKITQCKCGVCGRVGQFKTYTVIESATVTCD